MFPELRAALWPFQAPVSLDKLVTLGGVSWLSKGNKIPVKLCKQWKNIPQTKKFCGGPISCPVK